MLLTVVKECDKESLLQIGTYKETFFEWLEFENISLEFPVVTNQGIPPTNQPTNQVTYIHITSKSYTNIRPTVNSDQNALKSFYQGRGIGVLKQG